MPRQLQAKLSTCVHRSATVKRVLAAMLVRHTWRSKTQATCARGGHRSASELAVVDPCTETKNSSILSTCDRPKRVESGRRGGAEEEAVTLSQQEDSDRATGVDDGMQEKGHVISMETHSGGGSSAGRRGAGATVAASSAAELQGSSRRR